MNVTDPLLAPVEADEHREIGGVRWMWLAPARAASNG